jgi:hypothetical protein
MAQPLVVKKDDDLDEEGARAPFASRFPHLSPTSLRSCARACAPRSALAGP